jgi:hypothetical protein
MPEGVSYEGIVASEKDALLMAPNAGLTLYEQMGMASKASRFHGAAVMHKMPAPNVAIPAGVASGSGASMGAPIGGPMQAPPSPPPQKQELSTSNKKWVNEDVGYIMTDKEHAAFGVPKTIPEIVQPSPTSDTEPTGERALLESKLTPAVLERFDCWKKQASECKLAPDGTADVQLFLTENSAAVIDQLKALGVQISQIRKKERLVIARVPIDKLTDLANLQQIKFVSEPRR